jgi:hypothetical protein
MPESKAEKLEHLTFYTSCLYITGTWALRSDGMKKQLVAVLLARHSIDEINEDGMGLCT